MALREITIRMLAEPQLDALLDYLERHLAENGVEGTPLFLPQARGVAWPRDERGPIMRDGWLKAVGEPGWARAWAAYDSASGAIVGHADLTARREKHMEHRAMLGMGVDTAARRKGIARALLAEALRWAREDAALQWVDLRVLGGNAPAIALYRATGFAEVSRLEDAFRIDGESIADVVMTRRL